MSLSHPHRNAHRLVARVCLAASLGIALLTLPSAPAAAEERPARKVLLLTNRPIDLFVERIKSEVVALGLSVLIRAPSGPLEEDARSQRVTAAIRVLPANNGVEVWMADEVSGRSLLRQLIVDERPEGPDHNLIALQTAELLRTSLFSKPSEKDAPSPPVSPPPPAAIVSGPITAPGASAAPPKPAPGTATLGAQAGVGTLLSPGGAGPELQLWLSVRRFFGRRIGLALDLAVPLVRSSIEGPEGTAKMGSAMVGLGLLVRLKEASSPWFLTSGLGAGALRVGIDGQAKPTLTSSSSSVFTAAGYARIEGGYAVADWLRLGGQLLGGAALDRIHFRFAGNDAGSWGRPFAIATLFAEAGW